MRAYFQNLSVAVSQGDTFYLDQPPFNPGMPYPEYVFTEEVSSTINPAYDSVRNSFYLLGLDKGTFDTAQWNPLRGIVEPGNKVVIKPNFVLSSHYEGGDLFSIITHPSVIRVVVDYVYKALEGRGQIIIADAPQMDCNFSELLVRTQLFSIQELYLRKKYFSIGILDLRDFWLEKKEGAAEALTKFRKRLEGDPCGSCVVNVGEKSEFFGMGNHKKFYGADYNRDETIKHHHGATQEYMISKTILSADVVMSIPKLKVHKKVGVTLNAKGLVGINTNKNYLVHYTLGIPAEGGDQFPADLLSPTEKFRVNIKRFLYDILLSKRTLFFDRVYLFILWLWQKSFRKILGAIPQDKFLIDGGNWYGNDSTWKMVSDLMKIIVYADKNGVLGDVPQRKIFSVIDGIIGGENNGPLTPDSKKAGVIVAGFNPLAVDIVGTRAMGFDCGKIRHLANLMNNRIFSFHVTDPREIKIKSNVPEFKNMFYTKDKLLNFKPHRGWVKHVEIE